MFVSIAATKKSQEELAGFVRRKIKGGYPEGELRNDLANEGYSIDQIQKAFYSPAITETEKKLEGQQKTDNNPLWYLISMGLLITGIAIKSVSHFRESSIGTTLIVVGIVGLIAKMLLAIKYK